ncbi:MAG: glycosyl hydrolase [Anaerolineae bacterium]|nr:glycosyl hydrolase [Anaerolineae bacterium]
MNSMILADGVKKGSVFVAALVLLALAGLLFGRNTHAQSDPDPRFGAIETFWVPEEAAAMNLGWERILFYWKEIQPTGPDDWNTLHVDDRWLADAEANGREVVGLLKQTPAWATDGEIDTGTPRGLYRPIDDPENLWANYVRKVAEYYAPRGVHHWIIWNEPDIEASAFGHEFSGSIEDYYQMVKVASQVMKAVDPEAVIHLAGLTYWHDIEAKRPQYLKRWLDVAARDPEAAANGYFFDVLSLHIYFRVVTVPEIVEAMRDILAEHDLEKAIWITETNAAPDQDPAVFIERPRFPVDLDQQAWYLPQAFALGFGSGAERIGVYKFTDILDAPGAEPFGLMRTDLSKRPAFYAYDQLIERLSGFTSVEITEQKKAVMATFIQPKQVTRLLWSPVSEQVTVAVPALTETAMVYDVMGSAESITARDGVYELTLDAARCPGECIIGGPPLYLVEQTDQSVEPSFKLRVLESVPIATPTPAATVAADDLPEPVAPGQETPTLTGNDVILLGVGVLALLIFILMLIRHFRRSR